MVFWRAVIAMFPLACAATQSSPASSHSPAQVSRVPDSAIPAAEGRDAVVANGDCWVLGDAPDDQTRPFERFTYEHGRLREIVTFASDRRTINARESFEFDAAGGLVVTSLSMGDGGFERTRNEWTRDANGRVSAWKRIIFGEVDAEREIRRDEEGHVVEIRGGSSMAGSVELVWRWAQRRGGGWTVEIERVDAGASKEPRHPLEREGPDVWTLDARGRAVEHRSSTGIDAWTWDDRDRCMEHTHRSFLSMDEDPPEVLARRAPTELRNGGTITVASGSELVHELDDRGNVIAIADRGRVTRFEYDGEFRNAICHAMRPQPGAEWHACDLPTR